ncbi:hypothetical protein GP486_001987 [Trichoglossum hirsutum]|uniref:Fe2OG dioxygenase domain-containing protein n=1 Tax=Trichoglossum hirsutum TaxID=265104 RepID=A0A9P8LFT5_9PEZI|nr:hypothetical protein GP486_001987 [Trichoglossum hirsutum]
MELPTLDFSKFQSDSESERTELAGAIVDSFSKHGSVRLVNHGVPDQVVYDLFDWSERFFKLPLEEKMKIANERNPDPQRGWSYVGAEKTSKLNKDDLNGSTPDDLLDEKEHFDCSLPTDTDFPTKWPNEGDIPGFRDFMEKCIGILQNVGLQVLEAMEVGLALPPGLFVDRCTPPVHELRVCYYPPITKERMDEGKTRRTWPHSDFGMITLLFQDGAGGLEVEDRKHPGTYIPVVRGSPTEMVILISDTLEQLTNNVFRAGLHQVVVPVDMQKLQSGTLPERYSTTFFVKAGRHTSAGPLPQFVGPERPAVYKDITALQLHRHRVGKLYPAVHGEGNGFLEHDP